MMCAHCGMSREDAQREGAEHGYADHVCMAFLFDWAQAEDGEIRAREYGELMELMDRLGV